MPKMITVTPSPLGGYSQQHASLDIDSQTPGPVLGGPQGRRLLFASGPGAKSAHGKHFNLFCQVLLVTVCFWLPVGGQHAGNPGKPKQRQLFANLF